jgi:hypothetical protein
MQALRSITPCKCHKPNGNNKITKTVDKCVRLENYGENRQHLTLLLISSIFVSMNNIKSLFAMMVKFDTLHFKVLEYQ